MPGGAISSRGDTDVVDRPPATSARPWLAAPLPPPTTPARPTRAGARRSPPWPPPHPTPRRGTASGARTAVLASAGLPAAGAGGRPARRGRGRRRRPGPRQDQRHGHGAAHQRRRSHGAAGLHQHRGARGLGPRRPPGADHRQAAAAAALQDGAAALLVDVAGPVTDVLEGEDLLAVARGWRWRASATARRGRPATRPVTRPVTAPEQRLAARRNDRLASRVDRSAPRVPPGPRERSLQAETCTTVSHPHRPLRPPCSTRTGQVVGSGHADASRTAPHRARTRTATHDLSAPGRAV